MLDFSSCQWLTGRQKEPAGVQWLPELPQRSTGCGYYKDREANHKNSRRKVNKRPFAHPLYVKRTKRTSPGLLLEVDLLRCLLGHPLIDKGHTATVFGATGFLGRYIVNRLGMRQADIGLENMLMGPSNARMYRRCTISRGYGQEAFESHRGSWEDYVYG